MSSHTRQLFVFLLGFVLVFCAAKKDLPVTVLTDSDFDSMTLADRHKGWLLSFYAPVYILVIFNIELTPILVVWPL